MNGIAKFEPGKVDQDLFGNEIGWTIEIDLVADDVEHAALLDAGRLLLISEVDRHLDMDARAGPESQEIDMGDEVAHRFELDIAGDGAHHIAVDIEIDERRKEPAGVYMRLQVAIGKGDTLGLLLVAIEDTGNAAVAADCAGGPLAGPAACGSLELNDFGHWYSV